MIPSYAAPPDIVCDVNVFLFFLRGGGRHTFLTKKLKSFRLSCGEAAVVSLFSPRWLHGRAGGSRPPGLAGQKAL